MKPEDQRLAIARACNWKWDEFTIWTPDHKQFNRYHPMVPTKDQLYDLIPDYLNDLNACHEAAMWLRNTNPLQYVHYAAAITGVVARFNSDLETQYSISAHDATAAQRTEALLRTLGLWHE